jgi:ribosomal protein L7/L12
MDLRSDKLATMETPTPEEHATKIQEALFSGQKILAIKLYREQTGLGLAEAKDAVEKLEADLRATSPERFTAKPAGAGCMSLIVVGAVIWLVLG